MERREHYRVSADRLKEPSVIVVPSTGTPFRGALVDMSAAGAGVRVSSADCAELSNGERVVLVVGAHQFDTPLTVSAVNRYCLEEQGEEQGEDLGKEQGEDQGEDKGNTRCGFQFLDPQEFIRHLPAALTSLFDARNMIRVAPHKSAPVRVTVAIAGSEGEGDPAVAELSDISGVGLSLELDVGDAERIAGKRHVSMLIHLPNTPHALSMSGEIRYRLPLGDRWRFGIEFDPVRTESFELQRQEIVAYVIERQRQIEAEMSEAED